MGRQNRRMRILRFDPSVAASIRWRPYAVERASALEVAAGNGEAHIYVVYFEAGGVIGPHEAGFGQLLLPIAGSGWVAGPDGERVALVEGEAALIPRGEIHSKGSETGLAALMVQVRDLTPSRP
jgi:quercetin dioxygenase-like cupin family protein